MPPYHPNYGNEKYFYKTSAEVYFTMAVCLIFKNIIPYSHLKNVSFKRKIIVTTVLHC